MGLMRRSATAQMPEQPVPAEPQEQELSEYGDMMLKIVQRAGKPAFQLKNGGSLVELDARTARHLRNELNRFLELAGA